MTNRAYFPSRTLWVIGVSNWKREAKLLQCYSNKPSLTEEAGGYDQAILETDGLTNFTLTETTTHTTHGVHNNTREHNNTHDSWCTLQHTRLMVTPWVVCVVVYTMMVYTTTHVTHSVHNNTHDSWCTSSFLTTYISTRLDKNLSAMWRIALRTWLNLTSRNWASVSNSYSSSSVFGWHQHRRLDDYYITIIVHHQFLWPAKCWKKYL